VVINQKGGVGKTTTAINLTAGLNQLGKRVLGIDLDAQGHYTKFMGINTANKNTIVELMNEEATFTEVVIKTKYGDIIPADNNLSAFLSTLALNPNAVFLIKDWLEKVVENYDYVVIDCPPAINQLTAAALVAGDRVIIPSEAEYLSVDGVTLIADSISAAQKRLNPNLAVEGILLVKYQARRGLTAEVEEFLKKVAKNKFNSKVFKTKIRNTVDIPASQGFRQSVCDYSPKSNASKDYADFINEVLGGNK